jgi:hypothetical protein
MEPIDELQHMSVMAAHMLSEAELLHQSGRELFEEIRQV